MAIVMVIVLVVIVEGVLTIVVVVVWKSVGSNENTASQCKVGCLCISYLLYCGCVCSDIDKSQ